MTRPVFSVALLLLVVAAGVHAEETKPTLELAYLDLLPVGEFERLDLREAHAETSRKVRQLGYRVAAVEKKLAATDAKDEEARAKLRSELAGLQQRADAPLAEMREVLREHGLTDAMLRLMASAPAEPSRMERYSHRLVLLLEDLTPAQRAIFERVVPEVDGAYLAAQALHDRTELALKQSGLEAREVRGVLYGFRRQTSVIESRFWRLVDYVLEDDQKAALWEMLPTRMRQHSTPQDHVLTLPELEPSQAARVQALVTEVEAESAPDRALVDRTRKALREKGLAKEERDALVKEQRDAGARLQSLRRFAHEQTHEILTEPQIHAMKAIPPRVSINDRRRDGRRVFEGMEFDDGQQQALAALRRDGQEAARAYRKRMREIREDQGETGPDSPQMMMMEMMTAGARGEAQAMQRELLGRAFREVLTPDQVSGWVMGLYGDRR